MASSFWNGCVSLTPTCPSLWSRRSTTSPRRSKPSVGRSEEHTSELQSRLHLVCRLLLEKKKTPPSLDTPHGRAALHPPTAPCCPWNQAGQHTPALRGGPRLHSLGSGRTPCDESAAVARL